MNTKNKYYFLLLAILTAACSDLETELQKYVADQKIILNQLALCDQAISAFDFDSIDPSSKNNLAVQALLPAPSHSENADGFKLLESTIIECNNRDKTLYEYIAIKNAVNRIKYKRARNTSSEYNLLLNTYDHSDKAINDRINNRSKYINKNIIAIRDTYLQSIREKSERERIAKLSMNEIYESIILKGDLKSLQIALELGFCNTGCSKAIIYTIRNGKNKFSIVSELLKYSEKLEGTVEIQKYTNYEILTFPIEVSILSREYNITRLLSTSGKSNETLSTNVIEHIITDDYYDDDNTADLVKLLVTDIDNKDQDDLINSAIHHNKFNTLVMLVNQGFYFNKDTVLFEFANQYIGSPLAVIKNRYDQNILDYLINHGANKNAKNWAGLNALEARMVLPDTTSNTLITKMEAAGIKANKKRLEHHYVQDDKIKRRKCYEINNKWMRAVSKSLKGEELLPGEDISVPDWCIKYLNE